MKKYLKKYQTYLLVILTSIILVSIIFCIKGIYPFGNLTIANGDMGQSYMPFYVFLHDVVYEGKSIFYDYTLGMGSNMYGGFVVDGLFNPSSYLVLLNTRENVPYMISFVLMVKIAFISLTSYILFNNIFKNNKFYNYLFSIIYAFSGYVLTYNTNIMWLDVVGLFPLFILSIKIMFETNKIYWYSIILALILLYNYNLAYMVCLFVVLLVPIYILLGLPKEKRKQAILNIIFGSALAVGLSAFAILPSFYQVITSFRMSGAVENSTQNIFFIHKMAIILFYSLPIYGLGKWLSKTKEDKQTKIIYGIGLIMTTIIPILIEKVNLLWHSGSYQLFPYRYAFIPLLIISLGALTTLSKEKIKDNKQKNKLLKIIIIVLLLVAITIGILNAIYLNDHNPAFIMTPRTCVGIEIVCLLMIITLIVLSITQSKKFQKIIMTTIVISEILIYSYAYIGVHPNKISNRELSDKPVFQSYTIEEKLNIKDSLYRLKDLTGLTTESDSLIHNIPSIATFLHIISEEQVLNAEQLGYSHHASKIHNYGGTILSDAIYGVKYILTPKTLSKDIYNYVDSVDNKTMLYEYKNTLPIGLTYDKEVNFIPTYLNVFEAQNYLYKKMFNKDEDIIKIKEIEAKKDGTNLITIDVKEKSVLYFYAVSEINQMFVDGIPVIIPVTYNPNNSLYGNNYYNGIIELGVYENQTVTININVDVKPEYYILFGLLDVNKYNQIFKEYQSDISIEVENDTIKVTGTIDKDTNLFIPINYDKGWFISKNSKQTSEIKNVFNNFIGLDLQEGKVDIELKFRPTFYKIGIIISIISFMLLFIISYIKNKLSKSKIILNIAYYSFLTISIFFFIRIYIIGVIENFIN